MTPYYADDWLTVWQGDCREVMAQMPAESVHTVVTSPPYWGLRDYGIGGQLGLEPTPEEYVANIVAVFREVRRVLRSDGTCWVNLGDCYNSSPSNQLADRDWGDGQKRDHYETGRRKRDISGLKPKDLVGIPWRVAFALQADGWYLRSDIVWSKPNPMPESVTDRPTKAHEYLFLLSKSARYYYDADAVRETRTDSNGSRAEAIERHGTTDGIPTSAAKLPDSPYHAHKGARRGLHGVGTTFVADPTGRNLRTVWSIATQPYPGAHFATFPEKLVEPCVKAGTSERGVCPECGAPWRRVVERAPSTARTSGDGWQEGREDQIASGRRGRSRPGSFTPAPYVPPSEIDRYGTGEAGVHRKIGGQYQKWLDDNPKATTGWQPPDCGHYDSYTGLHAQPVPAVVLDPFAGSGTTGRVAQRLGRRAVLIDLSGEYLVQAMRRNTEIPLGLEAV